MWHMRFISAWLPLATGLTLLIYSGYYAKNALIFTTLPAALMIAGGMRMLLNPDLRGPQHAALGGVVGALLAFPIALSYGALIAAAMFGVSICAFIASGWFQLHLQPKLQDIPAPLPNLAYSAKVAVDNAFLSLMAWLAPLPSATLLTEVVAESKAAHEIFIKNGWLDKPESYHQQPPEIESCEITSLRLGGLECEYLKVESGYLPPAALPGSDRWLSYTENKTSHALILRRKEPAPWLICVHGFGMGNPKQDFAAFRAKHIFATMKVNIALFTLPVHGPRAPKGFNGAKFMALSPMDFVHAESQAIWDLRRLIGWIRKQGATKIGISGISLGAYTSAVLASIEDNLDCVIAGVPPADMMATGDYLASSLERRLMAAAGYDADRDRAIQSVVSPLSLKPRVPHDCRFMFAATGDQFVPIEQINALWQHWQQPKISWCTGGHVSALMQKAPRTLIDEAIAKTLCAP